MEKVDIVKSLADELSDCELENLKNKLRWKNQDKPCESLWSTARVANYANITRFTLISMNDDIRYGFIYSQD